ncbi:MAG: hypothetical protein JSV89_19615 [Spirochaetaceae bacterium]|nr:MAG: hypothetical protein JSV89_19615 [Spirochaetaceae bacterium]
MLKKLTLLLSVILLAVAGESFAQSNELLDTLFEEQTTTLAQAAYLVLTASGRISDDSTPEQAAATLAGQGWNVPERAAEEPLTLGEYSFLLMQAFEMNGGLMYRIFPGPRYAGRELVYLKLIKGNISPYRTFSGEEAIGILSRLLEWKEQQS